MAEILSAVKYYWMTVIPYRIAIYASVWGSGERGDGEEPDVDITSDAVHETLKNERRRMVLGYLSREEGPVSIGDLSEHVAALEMDVQRDQLGSKDRKRAYVGLYQSHLPKMDEWGIVEFDKQDGTIDRGVHFDEVSDYMEPDDDPTAARTVLVAGLVGLATFLTEVALGEATVISRIVLGASLLVVVVASIAILVDVETPF